MKIISSYLLEAKIEVKISAQSNENAALKKCLLTAKEGGFESVLSVRLINRNSGIINWDDCFLFELEVNKNLDAGSSNDAISDLTTQLDSAFRYCESYVITSINRKSSTAYL